VSGCVLGKRREDLRRFLGGGAVKEAPDVARGRVGRKKVVATPGCPAAVVAVVDAVCRGGETRILRRAGADMWYPGVDFPALRGR
jgi:hypothetical protein